MKECRPLTVSNAFPSEDTQRTELTPIENTYTKHSMPALKVDAQFTLVEAALKGYVKWKRHHIKDEVG